MSPNVFPHPTSIQCFQTIRSRALTAFQLLLYCLLFCSWQTRNRRPEQFLNSPRHYLQQKQGLCSLKLSTLLPFPSTVVINHSKPGFQPFFQQKKSSPNFLHLSGFVFQELFEVSFLPITWFELLPCSNLEFRLYSKPDK
ncbi:hypothetical protein D3C71_1206750 [compost metagenome]